MLSNLLLLATVLVFTTGQRNIYPQPLSTDAPVFTKAHNYVRFRTPGWGSVNLPYPTNAWFTNLALAPSNTSTEFPYLSRTFPTGITLCYPTQSAWDTSQVSQWSFDFTLSNNHLSSGSLLSYDTLSATYSWTSSAYSMELPHVPGSPYVTFYISAPSLNLTSSAIFLSVNGAKVTSGFSTTADRLKIATVQNGVNKTWIVYILTGSATLVVHPAPHNTFYCSLRFQNPKTVLRVALLPNAAAEPILDKYKDVIPSRGSVSVTWQCNGSPCDGTTQVATEALINMNWHPVNATGDATTLSPLMMAIPHQVDSIVPGSVSPPLMVGSYISIRGPLTGYVSSQWTLKENLAAVDVGFFPSQAPDEDKVNTINRSLMDDVYNYYTLDIDTYGYGKYLGQLANLVLIADKMDQQTLMQVALANLTNSLTPWMNRVIYRSTFLYDVSWGGVISANGWLNISKDYGNAMYNDHHFHYGYYIHAASVVLKYNASWVYKDHVMNLIRDIANPTTEDSYFPITRNKDWYEGHSWAQGLDNTNDGKDQESTAEAVNAYYAVALFGRATNNNYVRNLGNLLLATEIRSAQKYWHPMPGSTIYQPIFAKNGMVGILWSDKADYLTFFGARIEYVHCIQMLPFTPASQVLLSPLDWATYEFSVLKNALNAPGLQEEWEAYIYMAMSITDKQNAWYSALLVSDRAFEHGNSRTNMYWWISTRPTTLTTQYF